jgi:hypothetical protein
MATEKCQITFKGMIIRAKAHFSAESLHAMKEQNNIFQALKENNHQPTILYPASLSFRNAREIKTFQDKQNRKFITITTTPAYGSSTFRSDGKITAIMKAYGSVELTRKDAQKRKRKESYFSNAISHSTTKMNNKNGRTEQNTFEKTEVNSQNDKNNSLSINSLNINRLNSPIKRYRLADRTKNQDPEICCLQENHISNKATHRQRV